MLDKLNDLKNKGQSLTDVQGQMNNLKEQGASLKEKIIGLGKGGAAVLIVGLIAQLFLPWWSIAVVAFLVGIWASESPLKSFAYGTAAVTFLWAAYAGMQSSANTGIINGSISKMLGGSVSGTQLIFVTGLVGGLVGGMSAMTGTMLRQLMNKE
jgi:hypothetical protein